MKRLSLLSVLLFGGFAASALPAVSAPLPAPAFADLETTTNVAFAAARERMGRFVFTFSCLATPTNNVQVAFGTDVNTNGVLELEETDCIVGWDCGAWFVRNGADGECVRDAPLSSNDVRTLSWTGGVRPRALSATENGIDLFGSLAADPPDWTYRPTWNMMRLTGRGLPASQEHFRAWVLPDVLTITIR